MLRPLLAAFALSLLTSGVGCSAPPPKSANPTKPVPERRAHEIIGRAVRKKKMTPVEGHEITSQLGGKLRADVVVQEHKWGVAFLTANDLAQETAEPLPKKDAKRPNALVVVDAVNKEDAGRKVLVLFERDYLYDDQVGEDHEQTMITAESAIERDVTDFLVQAGVQGWELPLARRKKKPSRGPSGEPSRPLGPPPGVGPEPFLRAKRWASLASAGLLLGILLSATRGALFGPLRDIAVALTPILSVVSMAAAVAAAHNLGRCGPDPGPDAEADLDGDA
jgi:hypothetical protein